MLRGGLAEPRSDPTWVESGRVANRYMKNNFSMERKHLLRQLFTTLAAKPSLALLNTSLTQLDPWFITGFSDAEGSFSILIQHNTKFNTN